jgi:hypothetical protein
MGRGVVFMSDDRGNVVIFQARNNHSVRCGKPPEVDASVRKRYHGYFENEFGEQAIFIYDHEVNEGILYMGDAGWERAFKVIGARVPELVLSESEALWLYNCWRTATGEIAK